MIARNEGQQAGDVWARLAEPIDPAKIGWRQDGKAVQRGSGFVARFVAYIDAQTVGERLDAVVPGEWDSTLEILPFVSTAEEATVAVKCRVQILGVVREDIGQGRDYKAAATDAFKRAAQRFRIGHELYSFGQNWVPVDSDSRYAKPTVDPGTAYARKSGAAVTGANKLPDAIGENIEVIRPAPTQPYVDPNASPNGQEDGPFGNEDPNCPKCGGRMWDNRVSKRNPKAPDFKCRDRSCDGVVWPKKGTSQPAVKNAAPPSSVRQAAVKELDLETVDLPDEDLPF